MKKYIIIALIVFSVPMAALAAGGGVKPKQMQWHFDGPFGTFDRAALQRGLKVYRQVCASCHGMKQIYYRNLEALGYDEAQIKNIAASYTVIDGPNEDGDMFERPGIPSDRYVSPFENKEQAKMANGGAYPPDLSLITMARNDGPNYLYSLLTGYKEAPEGTELLDGQYWNKYMPGHVIAMAPPLSDGLVSYDDENPDTADAEETVEQYAKDLTEFLTWAGDPYMEERKRTGIKVILFLLVFAGIMYAYKKKIWADVH